MGSNEYSMLTMTKQPPTRKKSMLKQPSEYFSPSGTRNRWYRAQSLVQLTDELPNDPMYITSANEQFMMTKNTFKPPPRIIRGQVCKTSSAVDLDDKETGDKVYSSTSKDAHPDHHHIREKIIYPYRNASQIEMGKDMVDYQPTSHADASVAEHFKYGSPPVRNGRERNKSSVQIGIPHTPYIAGLPLMAMSMPEMNPSAIRARRTARPASVRVGSKSMDFTAGVVGRHRIAVAEAGRRAETSPTKSRTGMDPTEEEEEDAVDEDGNLRECEVEGEGEEEDAEYEEEDIVNGHPFFADEYTDYHHLDPLLSSTVPPQKIVMSPSPDRVTFSRGSVNKMQSQISIGWNSQAPVYASHEHSAFKKLDVKKYVPLDHQRTRSKVSLTHSGMDGMSGYNTVTGDDFRDISERMKAAELGTRIMPGKRQEHKVDVQRGGIDGKYPAYNKYLDDFKPTDVRRNSPKIVPKGHPEKSKTVSQFELQGEPLEDPWESNPVSMYETTAQREHAAKKMSPLWRQSKDYKFRSDVNLRHPVRNKHNMLSLYNQRQERQQAVEEKADGTYGGQ